MARKFSAFTNGLTNQSPTDTLVGLDLSLASSAQNSFWTLNSLFSVITRNITDGALRFGGFAAPAVSAAGQGSLYFDSSTNKFKISQNGGAYANLESGLSGLVSGNLIKASSTTTATDAGIVSTECANSVNSRYNVANYASLSAAVAAIGSITQATLVIASSISVTASLTVTGNITLEFTNAGALNISAAQVVTILGSINAPMKQIFTGSGSVTFLANRRLTTFYPQWWGGVPDGTTNSTAAGNAAIAAAISITGNGGGEVYWSAGTWRGNFTILQAKGLTMRGNGRVGTILSAVGSNPVLAANGLWYSRFIGLSFGAEIGQTGHGVVEIDGNYDGVHTQSVQANTFQDCLFSGQGTADGIKSTYTVTMCRQGGSSAQGSENLFLNCHFSGASTAVYFQNGFNALNNTFVGGNFASYDRDGIALVAGTVEVVSVGFQSQAGYAQVLSGGYDINCSSAGAFESIFITGCRTESLQFAKGGFSQNLNVSSFSYTPSVPAWNATTAYALNVIILRTCADGRQRFFRVTTAGTSGASEPSWPNSGAVADGSVTWTTTAITVIDLISGQFDQKSSTSVTNSEWYSARLPQYAFPRNIAASYMILGQDGVILADSTLGAITVTFPTTPDAFYVGGQTVTIKRLGADANGVTMTPVRGLPGGATSLTLPGGTLDAATFIYTGSGPTSGWYLVDYNSSQYGGAFNTKAGDPTTSDISASRWALYKNTSSGVLSLWANDGGVMKSVALT